MQIENAVGAAAMARSALLCLALVGLADMASAQTLVGPDIELRESALVVASAPVLSNGSGTPPGAYRPRCPVRDGAGADR